MHFSETLRAARTRMKLTQQEVADQLNINKTTYSGYETGKREPDVKRIKEICRILAITSDELLSLKIDHEVSLSDDDLHLLKKYNCLNEGGKKRVLGYMDGLLENSENLLQQELCPGEK